MLEHVRGRQPSSSEPSLQSCSLSHRQSTGMHRLSWHWNVPAPQWRPDEVKQSRQEKTNLQVGCFRMPGRYWGETTNGRSLSVARGFYWNSSLSFTLALKHFPQTSWHWKGAPEICCQSISAWRLYSCCILARFPTIACPAAALYMKLNCTGRPFHKYADILGIFRILLLI